MNCSFILYIKRTSIKATARTEVYTCNIEENPFEKGFFLKLLS